MGFCIITDSASDVPESVIKEYNLHVMPTPVTIEGTDYFDGETIFPDQFYEIQTSGKEIKTYIFDFLQGLQELLMRLSWLMRKSVRNTQTLK